MTMRMMMRLTITGMTISKSMTASTTMIAAGSAMSKERKKWRRAGRSVRVRMQALTKASSTSDVRVDTVGV